MLRHVFTFAVCALVLSGPLHAATSPTLGSQSQQLRRKGFFGTRLVPVTAEARDRQKLDNGVGILVDEVIPESTAAELGLERGDVILACDGQAIEAPMDFVRALASKFGGDTIALVWAHDGERVNKQVTLKERPRESSEAYHVEYGSVASKGGRLRTIVTRPKAEGKHPALFLIQGVGLFSIDNPTGPLDPYSKIIDGFASHGYVTLRVEKPGIGDSEGAPARDVDFDTEQDGYLQGLRMLKALSSVDPDRVVILGHSMGGVMGPLIAADEPVRGIIAYGTLARTWPEYMLENARRQLVMAEEDYSEIDRVLKLDAAIMTHLNDDDMMPDEVAAKFPELKDRIEQTYPNGPYFVDRSVPFFRQLAGKNLGEAWQAFNGHALALWGKSDYVSGESDHALIAEIVNRRNPGHGTYRSLDGVDHGMQRAASFAESQGLPFDEKPFVTDVLDLMISWADSVTATASER